MIWTALGHAQRVAAGEPVPVPRLVWCLWEGRDGKSPAKMMVADPESQARHGGLRVEAWVFVFGLQRCLKASQRLWTSGEVRFGLEGRESRGPNFQRLSAHATAVKVNVRELSVSSGCIWTGGGEERERCMEYMMRPSREEATVPNTASCELASNGRTTQSSSNVEGYSLVMVVFVR